MNFLFSLVSNWMEPFFFESGSNELFGVYHPAADVMSRKAILICPPLYAEYFRSYRVLRDLADGWAANGYHVMRFDYFGTGDSAGDWQSAGPIRWLQDIDVALTELQDLSGSDHLTLVGVRFGATLAVRTVQDRKVDQLLLWDPVLNGREYLQQLEISHQRLLDASVGRGRRGFESAFQELAGFDRAKWHDSELASFAPPAPWAESVDVVKTIYSVDQMNESVEVVSSECFQVEEFCDWTTPSESRLQVPQLLQKLTECL